MRAGWAVPLALVLLMGPGCYRRDAAEELLNAFGNACVTKGRWTEAALRQNRAFIDVLEKLKATDPCKAHKETIGQIQSLGRQVNGLITDPTFSKYRQAEETVQQLAIALQGAGGDPDLAAALTAALVQAKVDLATARAERMVAEETRDRDRIANATADLATLMQSILKGSDGLSKCLQQSPSSIVQLLTNTMAAGGSFLPAVFGASIAMIAQLANTLLEVARDMPLDATINRLNEAKLPPAMTCGLEAMTELYCNAEDAYTLLEFVREGYLGPGEPSSPAWKGMDILGRRLPVLIRWLVAVRNGPPPSDDTEAERRLKVWRKRQKIDNVSIAVDGKINDAGGRYNDAAGNEDTQKDILVALISGLSKELGGGEMYGGGHSAEDNPFRQLTSDSFKYACWLVVGIEKEADCPPYVPGQDNLDSWIRDKLLKSTNLTPLGVKMNWGGILDRVNKSVELEFFRTIIVNPRGLLASCFERSATNNITPCKVMEIIVEYLNRMKDQDDGSNPQLTAYLEPTIKMFNDALGLVQTPVLDNQLIGTIQELYTTFQLRNGIQYVQQTVSDLIRWDLQHRLDRGEFRDDVRDILRAAGGDLFMRLTDAGLTDLTALSLDLNKGKGLAASNIEIFREGYFKKFFGRAVKRYRAEEIRLGERLEDRDNRDNGQPLGELCMLLLSTGAEWMKQVPWEICSTAVLFSFFPDPEDKLTVRIAELERRLQGLPLRQRFCTFHRFLRAGRLVEALQVPGGRGGPRPLDSPEETRGFLISVPGQELRPASWMSLVAP